MSIHRFILSLIALSCGMTGTAVFAEKPAPEKVKFFESKIRPVLVEHCDSCHSPDAKNVKGGLLLHSREAARAGGDTGPAVVPGKPEESWLLSAMKYEAFEMPPSGKLPDRVIADFEKWIRDGAVDPRSGSAPAPEEKLDLAEGKKFWSFQPVEDVQPPDSGNSDWARTPIDQFILAKLKAEGLSPTKSADRSTLLRRISYDLTGLPPSPEAIRQFQNTNDPQAYEKLVDRLLASRNFGETWGRHWLDIARYADSTGGGRSRLYRTSWRYRDYVIESFNQDKSYQQFVKEQIAGDLLPAESLEQQREQLIGTAFLMLGPHNFELQDKQLLRMEVVDEQINAVGEAFLGMTIGCARCHDHKFDPIPTKDYYAMAGIFRSTKSLERANVSNWVTREMPVDEATRKKLDRFRKQEKQLQAKVDQLESKLEKLDAIRQEKSIPTARLAGFVYDNDQAKFQGDWQQSSSSNSFVGNSYQHDLNQGNANKNATFEIPVPEGEACEIRLSYSPSGNRASQVPITVSWNGQIIKQQVLNQKTPPKIDNLFDSLGMISLANLNGEQTDEPLVVTIETEGTDGYVIVDSVQILPESLLEKRPELAKSSFDRARERSEEEKQLIKELKTQVESTKSDLAQLKKDAPPAPPLVMSVTEQSQEEIGDTELCIRGNIRNHGPVVPRGTLSVIADNFSAEIEPTGSGRLELAQWIASPENPLTARIMVNRIWHHLFGQGIVRSVDNFGTMGERPSHPELLDYLAKRYIELGWSTKKLIREIVHSRTYQLASEPSRKQKEKDPENRLLGHFPRRRATAEFLRDSLLTLSGELKEFDGGNTVRPGTRSEYGYEFDSPYRSVYLPVFRNELHDMLAVFNFPDPNLVQGKRTPTTLATQALYLMNSPYVMDLLEKTARRIIAMEKENPARVDWLYLTALGRKPTDEERNVALNYLEARRADNYSEKQSWTTLCQAVVGSLEFRLIQ